MSLCGDILVLGEMFLCFTICINDFCVMIVVVVLLVGDMEGMFIGIGDRQDLILLYKLVVFGLRELKLFISFSSFISLFGLEQLICVQVVLMQFELHMVVLLLL